MIWNTLEYLSEIILNRLVTTTTPFDLNGGVYPEERQIDVTNTHVGALFMTIITLVYHTRDIYLGVFWRD